MVQHFNAKCPICYSDLIAVEVSALQCGHTFHYECIQRWLKESSHCPKCRSWASERNLIKQLYFDPGEERESAEELDDEESVVQAMEPLKAGLLREFMDRLKLTEQLLLTKVKKKDSETKLAQFNLLKAEVDNKIRDMKETLELYQRRTTILAELENHDVRSRNTEIERKLADMEWELEVLRKEVNVKQGSYGNDSSEAWRNDIGRAGAAPPISPRRGKFLLGSIVSYGKPSRAVGAELEDRNSFDSSLASSATFIRAVQEATGGRRQATRLFSQPVGSGSPTKSMSVQLLPNQYEATENGDSIASLWKEIPTSTHWKPQTDDAVACRAYSADDDENEGAFHKQYGNCTPLYR